MYQPQFQITSELLHLVSLATEARSWISQAVVDVTWLPTLQRETAVRLAHSSTAIEGNPLTLTEVEALARGDEFPASTTAKQEVINYLGAMKWIWGKKPHDSINEPDLLHLHRLLTRKTLPREQVGRYKTRPNRIVNQKGHTIYTPPPPKQTRPLTQELLSWINGSQSLKVHPIIVSAVAHHRLVSIHPFLDGNGRLSRTLGVWLLYTQGFDTHHLFALDEFYEGNRKRYYEKIQQARELDDDLTYWLEYCAEGILETLNKTRKRILSLQITTKAPRLTPTRRQEDVLRFLRDRGRVKSSDIEKAFKLTRARIGQIIKPLVDSGLVIREGQTRATTYRLA